MDLFASTPVQLVTDAEGGIRYWPGLIAPDVADAWFETLLANAGWTHHRRPMYERVVDVPRLMASYSTDALPAALPLADMLARVQACVPAPYSAVGLNLYRDGADSVAMHNDKLHTLVPRQPISLVSLGEPRRMLVRAKAGDARAIALDLAHGSLLSMSHAAQLTHEHGIPKSKRALGPRISCVFRVRVPGWTADD
jgi:alkylated DNA repair dioxygenase AlkB